jgi:hypothetical protein
MMEWFPYSVRRVSMAQFIEDVARHQTMLLPSHLDDVGESNPVRAIDAFADMLDPAALCFSTRPAATIGLVFT